MRRVLALLLLTFPATARAIEASPAPRLEQTVSGAIITRPVGAYLRYDWRQRLGSTPIRLGLFDSFLILSNEFGASVGIATTPEWLEVHVEAAAEPGFYVHLPAAGLAAGQPEPPRTFDWRYVVRGQANGNLIFDRWWIYSRSTALVRFRPFREDDVFREVQVRNETDVEQATALLFNLTPHPDRPAFWVYGEYTVGSVYNVGMIPHRVSGGVITERFLHRDLSLDLDVFYSIADKPSRGPGVILAAWFKL